MAQEKSYYRIPKESNLTFLPMAYFLPEEIYISCPTLRKVTRCFGELAKSDSAMAIVESDQFHIEVMDSVAAIVFPHFGFSGWKEHYTGYFPAWQLSYFLPIWGKLLEELTGWGLQSLFNLRPTEYVPFFDKDFINKTMSLVVKCGVEEHGWQPMLDVIREMPCDEDFEKVNSFARIDFIRKWYHTRSKKVKSISLEECLEDDEHGIHDVEDSSASFEVGIIGQDYVERFKKRLSEKDMKILEMRVEGFTYEEIAKQMGYKNHSGVIKRIRALAKEFDDYENERMN